MRKVDFFVVGAMKAGTTALFETLNKIPEVSVGKIKEFDFFIAERSMPTSFEDYHDNFESSCRVWGEVAPNYSKRGTFSNVARRIHNYNPNAKIIYIKRNPIQRALSELKMHWMEGEVEHGTTFHWFMNRRPKSWKRRNSTNFTEIPFGDFEQNYIIQHSRYEHQLAPFKMLFHENVLVLEFEDLVNPSDNSSLIEITNFIGVSLPRETQLLKSHSSSGGIIPSNFALELASVHNKLHFKHWMHLFPWLRPFFLSVGFLRVQRKTWFSDELQNDLKEFFNLKENQ